MKKHTEYKGLTVPQGLSSIIDNVLECTLPINSYKYDCVVWVLPCGATEYVQCEGILCADDKCICCIANVETLREYGKSKQRMADQL